MEGMSWLRMDPKTQQVLMIAREEAAAAGQNTVEAIHLLFGLLRVRETAVSQFLQSIGVTIETVRSIQPLPAAKTGPLQKPIMSATVQKIFENAARKARLMHDKSVKPHHLLVSLIDAHDSAVSEIWRALDTAVQLGALTTRGEEPAPTRPVNLRGQSRSKVV